MSENEIVINTGDFVVQGQDGTITVNGDSYSKATIIGVDLAAPGTDSPAFIFSNGTDTGFYHTGGNLSFSISRSHLDDIYNLFFSGKTIKENADEYMDIIMRLPHINENQLDAIETLEFFRRQFFPDADEK